MNRWKISLSICCAALLGSALALGASGSSILPGRPGPERIVEFATKQLQLDPAQQAALQPIVARAVSLRDGVRADGMSLLKVTRGAVSDPTGNVLVGVAERDARFDGRLAEFRAVRNELLGYYQYRLTPQQQARVRELMERRLDRVEKLRSALGALREESALWR